MRLCLGGERKQDTKPWDRDLGENGAVRGPGKTQLRGDVGASAGSHESQWEVPGGG